MNLSKCEKDIILYIKGHPIKVKNYTTKEKMIVVKSDGFSTSVDENLDNIKYLIADSFVQEKEDVSTITVLRILGELFNKLEKDGYTGLRESTVEIEMFSTLRKTELSMKDYIKFYQSKIMFVSGSILE